MMRISIERLRVWLLVGAGLLVVVIAAFLGYAHLRAHRFLKDLPGRLGVDITRESNGFTWSQSSKGKTVYTIHASKMVQRKDGKTTLHDVGIVLYGQKQDRADRIYGSEFEYDQKAGVVRALGEVHLDLQAPTPTDARGKAAYAAGHDPVDTHSAHAETDADADPQMIHVKTSNLVFVQKLGVASTDQEIEFQYHGMNGTAKGADYNSDTGITVLQSDVRLSGLRDGQPVLLTAAHAEMDRGKEQLMLSRARYVSVGTSAGTGADGRTLTAEQALVHLRADGSVERVLASQGVSVLQRDGLLKARNADVMVSPESRPETAHLSGGLTYSETGALREAQGAAEQGMARFNAAGRIESAVFTGAAEMQARERSRETAPWSDRTVSGDRLDIRFVTADGNRQQIHDGSASGAARIVLVDRSMKDGRPGQIATELSGDTLVAQMTSDGRTWRLSHVTGAGHTTMRRTDLTGAQDTSSGETLDVSFGASAAGVGKAAVTQKTGALREANSVSRAVQGGGAVTLTHLPGRKPGDAAPPVLVRAAAGEAVFEGDGQVLTLSGQAQVTEADSLLRAETVTMRQDTGDVMAEGGVRVSYRQAGSAEPVHVLAVRAELRHGAGHATFYGSNMLAARLWQGASQVEAPTIEFNQKDRTLAASASASGDNLVRTVLVSTGGSSSSGAGRDRPQILRVSSRTLRYSDADRRATFGGGVVLQVSDGTVRGLAVVALLRPVVPSTGSVVPSGGSVVPSGGSVVPSTGSVVTPTDAKVTGFMGGSVDRVTADGAVEVSQRGRRALGEHLVYTAIDGVFVMTGTPALPPKVVDEVQGTVTGAALQFHAGDNSVMVLGNAKGGEGRRVHTETQVRQH